MEKIILLIDDIKASVKGLETIKTSLKKKQIEIISEYINPLDKKFWDENKNPILEKVINGIVSTLSNRSADLIIIDNYYGDASFSGLKIIENLRNINEFKSTSIFLTSGKRDHIVSEIFNSEKSDIQKVNDLSKLINYKIDGFLDKDYHSLATQFLMESSADKILISKLKKFKDKEVIINTFSGRHAKMNIKDLATKIENKETGSTALVEEMVDLTIAHYIDIENEL